MHLKIHNGWKGSTLSCSTMWDCAIYLIHPNKLEKLKDLSICQSFCIIVYNDMIYLFWAVSVTYFLIYFQNNDLHLNIISKKQHVISRIRLDFMNIHRNRMLQYQISYFIDWFLTTRITNSNIHIYMSGYIFCYS